MQQELDVPSLESHSNLLPDSHINLYFICITLIQFSKYKCVDATVSISIPSCERHKNLTCSTCVVRMKYILYSHEIYVSLAVSLKWTVCEIHMIIFHIM